ncbi:hypothetical protein FN976_14315 [Caenimonas sedimenti]|uniref:Uncharacterized protein n=1 Tax=Caenimonas sedimenti TaxID=2596921 RepID=A0A562ZQA9_9BURK|nr:hypothetical protein [Caenimonas sedimenti]TWO70723.1 hypothetical protein FN976_14315 [Caenimonas sedimenti]
MSDTPDEALHAAGYRCGNPACRAPLTLDTHQLVALGGDGSGGAICLCAGCHAMQSSGAIPVRTLRAWKLVQQSLTGAFGAGAPDTLLLLRVVDEVSVDGDGLLRSAGLLNSGLLEIRQRVSALVSGQGSDTFKLRLSTKGRQFVEAWINGRQGSDTSL